MKLFKNWFRQSGRSLKCAAVTPVGPGHAARARECKASIEAAWRESAGPFSQLEFFFVDDSAGALGRSKARNVGVQSAQRAGADWIFFLDADDLMTARAFSIFSDYAEQFDAVWGLMAIKPPDDIEHHIRFPQALTLRSVDELLLLDPFITLLMGHFVRTSVALQLPFDESMDAGEDFDYYIRAWEKYRCIKIAQVLSVNRSDQHSSGPRSATADQWRTRATERLSAGLERNGICRNSARAIAAINRCSAEAQAFSRARDEATRDSVIALSRRLPYRGFVDVIGYAGGDFVLFTNNDDAAALNIAWTGEYVPASARLWQALAAGAPHILDFGAAAGYFGLLASRAEPAATIVCVEPSLPDYARLELNLALNEVRNVRAICSAVTRTDEGGECDIFSDAESLASRSGLPAGDQPPAPIRNDVSPGVDSFHQPEGRLRPKLIRLAAGEIGDRFVAGMVQTLSQAKPDLLIAAGGGGSTEWLEHELRRHGYRYFKIDEDLGNLVESGRLTAGSSRGRQYWWATARSGEDVLRIAAAADCNLASLAPC